MKSEPMRKKDASLLVGDDCHISLVKVPGMRMVYYIVRVGRVVLKLFFGKLSRDVFGPLQVVETVRAIVSRARQWNKKRSEAKLGLSGEEEQSIAANRAKVFALISATPLAASSSSSSSTSSSSSSSASSSTSSSSSSGKTKHVCKVCHGKKDERKEDGLTEWKEAKTLKCGGCSQVHYCSRECQKQDWKEHKLVCKSLPE